MYSFRKSFFPTPEEPGFVTDYGGCRMGKAFFAEKACGLVDHVCDGYTEERGLVEWARARLAELA